MLDLEAAMHLLDVQL